MTIVIDNNVVTFLLRSMTGKDKKIGLKVKFYPVKFLEKGNHHLEKLINEIVTETIEIFRRKIKFRGFDFDVEMGLLGMVTKDNFEETTFLLANLLVKFGETNVAREESKDMCVVSSDGTDEESFLKITLRIVTH